MNKRVRKVPYRRHTLPVRIMHWVNVITLTLLLGSGLQIFNAHPTLNWGRQSYDGKPPVLAMRSEQLNGRYVGVTEVFGREYLTTGVLGLSRDPNGRLTQRGFPGWATLPSSQWLARGRNWHFFLAWIFVINGLAYVAYGLITHHVQRDLTPGRTELRGIGRSILDHLRFRHPVGDEARHYNVLQKLAYLFVIFILLPFVILMGLGMSPTINALLPGWVDIVGGRQSARTLHFAGAMLIVLFALVHVFEVLITGVWNNIRSMITGRYVITLPAQSKDETPAT